MKTSIFFSSLHFEKNYRMCGERKQMNAHFEVRSQRQNSDSDIFQNKRPPSVSTLQHDLAQRVVTNSNVKRWKLAKNYFAVESKDLMDSYKSEDLLIYIASLKNVINHFKTHAELVQTSECIKNM